MKWEKYNGKKYKIYLIGLPSKEGRKPHQTEVGWINTLFDLMEDEGLPRPRNQDLRRWEKNGIDIVVLPRDKESYNPDAYMRLYLKLASIANDYKRKKVVILFGRYAIDRWKGLFNDRKNILVMQRTSPFHSKPSPFYQRACRYLGLGNTSIWRL